MTSPQPTPASAAQKISEQFSQARQLKASGQLAKADEVCHALLIKVPEHQGALHLRAMINRELGRLDNAEHLLIRLEALTGKANTDVLYEWGVLRFSQGRAVEAEAKLKLLLEAMPQHANGQMVLGRIYEKQGRLGLADIHLRFALNLRPEDETICKDLASIYERLGLFENGARFARLAYNLNPKYVDGLLVWAKLEERRNDFDKADRLIDYASKLQPNQPLISLLRAYIQRRRGNFEQAYKLLKTIDANRMNADSLALSWQERGFCLERLGRFDEAFTAFDKMSALNRKPPANRNYPVEEMNEEFEGLRQFWQSVDVNSLSKAKSHSTDEPVPVFILGFPRSGTTLVEQIISSHSKVLAGDETHALDKAMGNMSLGCNIGTNLQTAQQLVNDKDAQYAMQLRHKYMYRVRQQAILEPGYQYFTDKTPLNETHMGLIHCMLPEAPMVHLIRHPLNVVLSSYFNDVRHGRGFATRLETTAIHYAHTMDMIETYRERLKLRYLAVRYEDIVHDLESNTREIIDFIGLPWEDACLNFQDNKRHVRTASADQVQEKLYTRSLERYKPFLKQLEPVIPILEPYMEKLGYKV